MLFQAPPACRPTVLETKSCSLTPPLCCGVLQPSVSDLGSSCLLPMLDSLFQGCKGPGRHKRKEADWLESLSSPQNHGYHKPEAAPGRNNGHFRIIHTVVWGQDGDVTPTTLPPAPPRVRHSLDGRNGFNWATIVGDSHSGLCYYGFISLE